MSLSKDEQRRFDEIERALREDDPMFAARTSLDQLRRHRVRRAAAAFLLGLLMVMAGVVAAQAQLVAGVIVSVTGFRVMLAAAGPLVGGSTRSGRPAGSGHPHR